ncbi:hypothetical protein JCM11491_004022 [Sporobolomyces phaffii]
MRSAFAAVSVLSLASLAAAQTGYGRFPCTIVNGDGTYSQDQSQCASGNLVNPGSGESNTGVQGDRPNPVDPVCVQQLETTAWFCGSVGAACSSDANCDNGLCVDGKCQGGFTQACASTDTNCSGFLYCISPDFSTTASDTCGGLGAYCQDPTQGNPSAPAADNYPIFNQYCSSGYCNAEAACDEHATTVGADCSVDPQFKCSATSTGQALTCDETTFTCQLAAVPSGRARARRNLSRRSDAVANTLENCGGQDCTLLEGVSSVSCSAASVCEIWACADGYVFDADSQACVSV